MFACQAPCTFKGGVGSSSIQESHHTLQAVIPQRSLDASNPISKLSHSFKLASKTCTYWEYLCVTFSWYCLKMTFKSCVSILSWFTSCLSKVDSDDGWIQKFLRLILQEGDKIWICPQSEVTSSLYLEDDILLQFYCVSLDVRLLRHRLKSWNCWRMSATSIANFLEVKVHSFLHFDVMFVWEFTWRKQTVSACEGTHCNQSGAFLSFYLIIVESGQILCKLCT